MVSLQQGSRRRRWNSGRAVGPRAAFDQPQLTTLREVLGAAGRLHDLALLMVGVDAMLRASDLLRLRVRDVTRPDGSIRSDLVWRQRKTAANVALTLTPAACDALAAWIALSGKTRDHFLFTRCKAFDAEPINPATYRRVVKGWARLIGLDPSDYSSHSIRRTKAIFMYRRGVAIADLSKLLGHRSTDVTLHYLGVTAEHLRAQALKHDIFAAEPAERQP